MFKGVFFCNGHEFSIPFLRNDFLQIPRHDRKDKKVSRNKVVVYHFFDESCCLLFIT
jgi:protein-disulfide isomerase